jgi:hypothetical protein
MVCYCCFHSILEFFKTNFIEEQLIVNLVLVLALLFYFANEKDPAIILFLKTSFWWLM